MTDKIVPTVQEAVDEYIRIRKLKARTAYGYQAALNAVVPDWLDLPITEINKDMIVERHRGYSEKAPGNADYVMRVMRALLSWASEYYGDDEEPLLRQNPVRRLTVSNAWNKCEPRIDDRIDFKDIGRWFHAVRGVSPTMRDYLFLLLLTGLRRNEGAMLQWDDVDLENGLITIPDTKNGSDHILPLSTWLIEMLWYRRVQNGGKREWIFPGQYGSQYITSCYRAAKLVTKETGIVFTPHTLRRTFVSLATHPDVGADELEIKGILNHATTSVTWRHYLRPNPERLRPVIQAVTDLVLREAGVEWTQTRAL